MHNKPPCTFKYNLDFTVSHVPLEPAPGCTETEAFYVRKSIPATCDFVPS